MPELIPARLIRRHLAPFAFTLGLLTTLMMSNSSARGQVWGPGSIGSRAELFLLALPAVLALTIPMALFVGVLWTFTGLGSEGSLSPTLRDPGSRRRLLWSVGGAAAVIAALMLIVNAEILPRANGRLMEILAGRPVAPSDRSMTLTELFGAAGSQGAGDAANSLAANRYQVEIQKKFALAASCIVLALMGAVLGFRFHRARIRLVLAASTIVFTTYYICLIGGETLADSGRIPPFVAMWMANAALLGVAILLGWRQFGSPGPTVGDSATAG